MTKDKSGPGSNIAPTAFFINRAFKPVSSAWAHEIKTTRYAGARRQLY